MTDWTTGTDLDAAAWQEALAEANIPALLTTLVQLTGDTSWIEDPFLPQRTRGLSDNNSGGLPPDTQQRVRDAALDAILAWQNGKPPAISHPQGELFIRMMSVCVGEEVNPEYAHMMAEEMGFEQRDSDWPATPDPEAVSNFSVVVIGAGVSGICAAVKLEQAGIPYTVLEKNPSIGGTWYENRYPGCGVDTPSHLYSFSFARNNWPRYFSKQKDILAYLERVAGDFGVRGRIRTSTEVISATWDEDTATWTVVARSSGQTQEFTANVVISAVGLLNRPVIPPIPGIDSFRGPHFHTARWPDNFDVTGQRVAVIGSGASAMQLVPAIADEAAELVVFQRSPQWAAPSENYRRSVSPGAQRLMDRLPFYQGWYRFWLAWSFNDRVHTSLQIDPEWPHPGRSINAVNDAHRRFFVRYLTGQLGDRTDLLGSVLPTYPPFGKRMLIDNGWYTTVARDDVQLVTGHVVAIDADGVQTADGSHYDVDVVVFATGFDTLRMLAPMTVIGRDGANLRERWGDDDARAYLGMTMPEFPNFYCLYGPNTNLGHGGSAIFLTECAVRYIMDLIRTMIIDDLASAEIRPDVHDRYNELVDEAHSHMIWSHPGMDVWYRNAKGRVVTNSPWRIVDYWAMTKAPNLQEYTVRPHRRPPSPGHNVRAAS